MVNKFASRFNEVVSKTTVLEREMLSNQIDDLDAILKPGISVINWRSQRIKVYIDSCNQALDNFCSTQHEVTCCNIASFCFASFNTGSDPSM